MKKVRNVLFTIVVVYSILCVAVYFLQEKLMFFPERLSKSYDYDFNSDFSEFNIQSASGNVLNALHFKTDSAKGIVIYFHGNAGSLASWGTVSDDFISNHYDLLIFDYPGYGKSTGKMSEENLFLDAQSVYDFCREKFSENRIVLYGRSIGTGIAAYLASGNHPGQLILEAPYYSMVDLSSRLYPFLPSFILRYPLRTDLFLEKVDCPVTIIHGTEDEVIYPESSEKLKPLLTKEDEVHYINGGHHNDLNRFQSYKDILSLKLK